MDLKPSTEERIWAVLSHLSALAFGMGVLLPIIGWSEQRRKSKYASFQCLQALGYQSLGYTVWLLAYLVLVIVFTFVGFSPIARDSGLSAEVASTAFLLVGLGSLGIYMLFPVMGAVSCALGKDYRYPLMGNRLFRYLGYELANNEAVVLIEEHEERWVASMSHFTVIIALWGLLAPFTTWAISGRSSAFLRFQSIQTSIYQVFVNMIYLGASSVAFMAVIPFFAFAGLEGDPNGNSSMAIFGLVSFLVFMLIAIIIFMLLPLFHILGQWAGYRVLKGDDYHYPIIGRLVEKRLRSTLQPPSPTTSLQENIA